jgi:hypothetical protein
LARVGLSRLTPFVAADPDLPAHQQQQLRAIVDGSQFWDSYSPAFRVVLECLATDQLRC